MDRDEIDWERVRQVVGAAVARSSQRHVAREIGVAHPTIARLIVGGIPEGAVREKILRYVAERDPVVANSFHVEQERGEAEQVDPQLTADARYLAGAFEGVMWSTERMTAELHSIIRDARQQMRLGRWAPPERDLGTRDPAPVHRAPAPERKAAEPSGDSAAATRPTIDAAVIEAQLSRLEAILARDAAPDAPEEQQEPAMRRSQLTLEERMEMLARGLERLRSFGASLQSPQSPPAPSDSSKRAAG